MAESMSFKAYLKRAGQEPEVRRFGLNAETASSYLHLRNKLQALFPSIQNDNFRIFWHDGDDFICVDSSEELQIALDATAVMPIKLHVHVETQPQTSQGNTGTSQLHAGVVCDGCENEITGFRYKCVSCPDFDLCSRCEGNGLHSEHFMLRITTPLSPHMRSKYFRKFLHKPHKFTKHHGWNRGGDGCSGSTPPPPPRGPCPFMREEGPAPKVADMFDFSALLDFITRLGVVINDNATTEPTATASSQSQASGSQAQASGSQAQASGSQSQASGSQAQPSGSQAQPSQASSSQSARPAPGNQYLTSINEAVKAFLDPLGVDVSIDVHTNGNRTTAQSTAAATSTTTASSTTASGAATPVSIYPVIPNPLSQVLGYPVTTTPTTPHTNSPAAPNSQASAPAQVPAAAEVWAAMIRDNQPLAARRSSDDWTLINRESPARDEAMAIDGEEGRPRTISYQLGVEPAPTTSAPPQVDPERQRLQDAFEKIQAMGFNIDPNVLKDLLSSQNCDIATVLEMLLGGLGKK